MFGCDDTEYIDKKKAENEIYRAKMLLPNPAKIILQIDRGGLILAISLKIEAERPS
jgi:hypothetical protein